MHADPPLLPLARLHRLWLQVGSTCNLSCSFCHEGSAPADTRLPALSLAQARQAIDQALALGATRFGFTGGEPLIHREIVPMLEYALAHGPALVLTNGTAPLIRRPHHLARLAACAHPLTLRVSLDYPDEARHDAGRGLKNFRKALQGLATLHQAGFAVGVTRRREVDEDAAAVEARFRQLFTRQGLPADLPLVALPELGPLGSTELPAYPAEANPPAPQCTLSRTALAGPEGPVFLPCPFVDDDPRYTPQTTLAASAAAPTVTLHPRCRQCLTVAVPYAG